MSSSALKHESALSITELSNLLYSLPVLRRCSCFSVSVFCLFRLFQTVSADFSAALCPVRTKNYPKSISVWSDVLNLRVFHIGTFRSSLEFLFFALGVRWHFSLQSFSLLRGETDWMWRVGGWSCSRRPEGIFREDQITAALWQQLQSASIRTLRPEAWRAAAESEPVSSRKTVTLQRKQKNECVCSRDLSVSVWAQQGIRIGKLVFGLFWHLQVRLSVNLQQMAP